jgi:hypothetical protein
MGGPGAEIYRLDANPEWGGIVPPHSVMAPGTALELLLSRALPSAQVRAIVARYEDAFSREMQQRGDMRKPDSDGCSI